MEDLYESKVIPVHAQLCDLMVSASLCMACVCIKVQRSKCVKDFSALAVSFLFACCPLGSKSLSDSTKELLVGTGAQRFAVGPG